MEAPRIPGQEAVARTLSRDGTLLSARARHQRERKGDRHRPRERLPNNPLMTAEHWRALNFHGSRREKGSQRLCGGAVSHTRYAKITILRSRYAEAIRLDPQSAHTWHVAGSPMRPSETIIALLLTTQKQ
jgi:hypothetical protein